MRIDFTKVTPYVVRPVETDEGDSFLKNVNRKAMACLKEIIEMQAKEEREEKENKKEWDSKKIMQLNSSNKIIAFMGERGSGKSTAMISFVHQCVNDKIDFELEHEEMPVFFTLPVIDPSRLSADETIVGAITSRIYQDLQRRKDKLEDRIIADLAKKCRDVHKAFRVRYLGIKETLKENPNDLEHLSMLAQTNRLHSSLQELINAYLNMLAGSENKKAFLIIPIDDLDANISNGFEMSEEIRNFLMLPNVIIPIAIKMEQILDAIEQRFFISFKELSARDNYLDARPAEMASKYIQKLIPDSRRVTLPQMTLQNSEGCFIRTPKKECWSNAVDYFCQLICDKTGILLVKNEYHSHSLFPMNLRNLHQTMLLLESLKTIDKINNDSGNTLMENLSVLEKWLLENAGAQLSSQKLVKIVSRFFEHSNQGINVFLLNELADYGCHEAKEMLKGCTRVENISIGDILYLLRKITANNMNEEMRYFAAVVRMAYSIRIQRQRVAGISDPEWEKSTHSQLTAIFNGLVYNQNEKLTYDGFEKKVNIDAISMSVTESGEIIPLLNPDIDSQMRPDVSGFYPMELKEMVWSSLFVVGFGRVRREDIHTLEDVYLQSILPWSEGVSGTGTPAFMAFNWMAFVHNLLEPKTAVERIFWQCQHKFKNALERYTKEYEDIRNIVLFEELHLESIDVLNAIIDNMVKSIFTIRKCMKGQDDIAKVSGYFYFRETFLSACKEAFSRTVHSLDDSGKPKEIDYESWELFTKVFCREHPGGAGEHKGDDDFARFQWLQ